MWWIASLGLARAAPEQVDQVVRALSSRDPVSCAEIEALTPTPVETLSHVVDNVPNPPWAPMRAADCLIRNHAVESRPNLERWVVAPELKGLGRLVLGSIDTLPVEVAVPVMAKALAGSDPALATTRCLSAAAPEVRTLAVKP